MHHTRTPLFFSTLFRLLTLKAHSPVLRCFWRLLRPHRSLPSHFSVGVIEECVLCLSSCGFHYFPQLAFFSTVRLGCVVHSSSALLLLCVGERHHLFVLQLCCCCCISLFFIFFSSSLVFAALYRRFVSVFSPSRSHSHTHARTDPRGAQDAYSFPSRVETLRLLLTLTSVFKQRTIQLA